MIAVIFELEPKEKCLDNYLDIAGSLLPHLESIDGFISVERFESLANPGKYLSLSFFENEEAVRSWRNLEIHRNAQSSGRNDLFKNYRLRVASVLRDYGLTEREQAPSDSKSIHNNT
ncbi:MAG: antibiotic biosynthesis monooxygenase [Cohaesibacteraceae bacterium]|nr:antibiotic biosynthesis monooxygenase [Cohaesibacteraceae bacterium]